MPISLKFVPTDIVNIEGPPQPGFQLCGNISNSSDIPLAVLGLSFGVRTAKGNLRVQPDRSCSFSDLDPRLLPGATVRIYLPIHFAHEVLSAIEEKRATDADVELLITAHALAAPIHGRQADSGQPLLSLGLPERTHVEVRSADGRDQSFTMSRDAWLGCLKAFRFSDVEVFELPTLDMKAKGLPSQALALLRQAELAFRAGDWDGTLTKFRGAFEAVATATGQSANTAAGFKALWLALFPEQIDDAKRKALDEVVDGLNDFQQLGRHKKFPFTPVDRHDALLALRMSLALFEYIGARSSG